MSCPIPFRRFPTWKTVTIGKLKTSEAYLDAMESAGFSTGCVVMRDILSKTKFLQEESMVKICKVTVRELGFPYGARLDEIYERATEYCGLALCHPEIAPAVRIVYPEQRPGEWLFVAMKTVLSHLCRRILEVNGCGYPGLQSRYVPDVWQDPFPFVFQQDTASQMV